MSHHAYAGIGSRKAPNRVLQAMTEAARQLAHRGYILRTGHAQGSDQAFERGAGAQAEIYLPWPSFNDWTPHHPGAFVLEKPSQRAIELAQEHHPAWTRLNRGAQLLHSRNSHQILGLFLQDPIDFVLCWTPDGATGEPGINTGGTGQALRLAAVHKIPVFNLAREDHYDRVMAFTTQQP